jgi:hypothetical protein
MQHAGGGVVKWAIGWIVVLGFAIGGLAWISGDLGNADNIGGTVGDVGGAGIFGGIFGDEGMIDHAQDQQAEFMGGQQAPTGPAPANP